MAAAICSMGIKQPSLKAPFCVAPGDTCVKLCAVGDTGLKTGWVRCRHGVGGGRGGAGWGGVGRGGVGWGVVVTYFADRIVPQYKSRPYSPGNSVQSVQFSLCPVTIFTAVLSVYSLHREVLRKRILH